MQKKFAILLGICHAAFGLSLLGATFAWITLDMTLNDFDRILKDVFPFWSTRISLVVFYLICVEFLVSAGYLILGWIRRRKIHP